MAAHDPQLKSALGRHAKIIATGLGPDGPLIVGTKDRLAAKCDGKWVVMGWHEVERGAWRGRTQRFQWSDFNGRPYEVELADPGQMPMLFQERVQASTVMTLLYDLDRGEVRIVVRRALDGSDAMSFYAVPSSGASLDDPQTAEFVVRETDRLRAEYGLD